MDDTSFIPLRAQQAKDHENYFILPSASGQRPCRENYEAFSFYELTGTEQELYRPFPFRIP